MVEIHERAFSVRTILYQPIWQFHEKAILHFIIQTASENEFVEHFNQVTANCLHNAKL